MGKGYALENETETMLMDLAGQDRDMQVSKRCHRITSSGAMRGDKGDVVSENVPFFEQGIMIECKRRRHRLVDNSMVFRLPEAWIIKNEGEAAEQERLSFFLCAFTGAQSWRKFVVGSIADVGLFLRHVPSIITAGPEINKKGTFIFNKQDMSIDWSADYRRVYGIQGADKVWYVLSYKFFVELLEGKKRQWQSDQLGKSISPVGL